VEPSFVSCDFDPETQQLTGFDDILGRVASIPIAANSILQRELLAPQGTLPGLINLLDKNHSLIDLSVPQLGFNVFIKPNDLVDLYQVYESSSKLIASKVKVILVDSKPLGKAPLRVAVSNKSRRELTVSIPEEYFSTVVKAKKNKRLIVTYKNKERELVQVPRIDQAFKSKSLFQSLLMIHGPTKEVFGQ
jgi:Flp pilus assembly protein CpaB